MNPFEYIAQASRIINLYMWSNIWH